MSTPVSADTAQVGSHYECNNNVYYLRLKIYQMRKLLKCEFILKLGVDATVRLSLYLHIYGSN